MNWLVTHRQAIADHSFLAVFLVLPFLDILAPISIGLLLATAIFAKGFVGFKTNNLESNKAAILVMVFFALTLLTLTYTVSPDKTIEKIGKNIAFLIIPLAFIASMPSLGLIKRAQHVFVFACSMFCVFSLLKLGYHYIVYQDESHWYNFVQMRMYHKYMPEDAMYLNTAFVFLLFGNFKKQLKLVVGLLFFTVIVLFGVRLGLFIFMGTLGAYGIKNYKSLLNFRSLIIAVVLLLLGFLLIQTSTYASDKFYDTLDKIGFNTKDKVTKIGEEYHAISLRSKVWKASAQLIKEKPIIGYGAGAEKPMLNTIFEQNDDNALLGFHSHNQYLSVLLQYGIVGLLLLLAILFMLLKKVITLKSITYGLVLYVLLVSMITESYFELQQGLFYFGVFVSLIAVTPQLHNKHS